MGELLHHALVDLRTLTLYESRERAHDLAYALHNLPVEIYGWGTWDPARFRGRLLRYQRMYYDEKPDGPDYVAMFERIFPETA